MYRNRIIHNAFSICVILIMAYSNAYAQSMDTPFGKNRVQYHHNFDYWDKYESDHFIVYWYGRNKYLGQSVVQIAELDHDEVRKVIEHKINDKIEIIVYTDLSDLKQSNVGVEDAFHNKSGETLIAGNKMYVYFDGNHQHLRTSIREGIASVYLGALMLGTNFQEILQSSVLLDLPEWYTKGLVSFAGDYWNINIEDELRDVMARDPKMWSFKKISEKHPRLAGHSFWNYISQQYGKSTISNVVYLTKISSDIKGSFEFVLNTPYLNIISGWEEYYRTIFEGEADKFTPFAPKKMVNTKNKKYRPISHVLLNNKENKLAYMVNNLGKMELYVKDLRTDKDKKIWKNGFKNSFQQTDYEYPALTWHPTRDELSYAIMIEDEIILHKVDVASGKMMKQPLPLAFQRVYSLSYLDDRYYVMSASIEGVSDLFLYDTKERDYLNITSDYYDDIDASFTTLDGEKGILFVSNRQVDHILPERIDSMLPLSNLDVFFFPMPAALDQFGYKEISKTVRRLTFTNTENERYPSVVDSSKIVYLSGISGINNAHITDTKTDNTYALTNLSRNIIRHDIGTSGNYYYTLYEDGKYRVYNKDLSAYEQVKVHVTDQKKWMNTQINEYINQKAIDSEKAKNTSYTFQSKYKDPPELAPIREQDNKPIISTQIQGALPEISDLKGIKFIPQQVTAAGLLFRFHNVTTRLDNEVLFEGLELFGGQNPQTNQLPMGFLAKATVSDLFEDHKFEGGLRIPTSFNGSEFFLTYDNNKNRIDRRYALYRRTLTEQIQDQETFDPFNKSAKEQIVGMVQLKYPLNIYGSVRAITSLRFDRNYRKSLNEQSFSAPVAREKRLGLRLEYVYDNSFNYDLNILHGSRIKVYSEAFNQFELDVIDGFSFQATKGFTSIVGADVRHYIPVLKHSVLALRGATAFSFGNKPNLYYLGGVNNQFFNSFNQSASVAPGEYAFQTNANHMRGFQNNIRNGTRFALINTELRLPVFRYLLGKNNGMSFIRHMQLIGFFDAGMAWYGASPYSRANPINTETVTVPQITVEVKYFRDPVVASYGAGLRTKLFGYFLRVDYAYGIETRIVQKPRLHLSMGFDF